MDSPRCQNPVCGQPITVVHGHRARKYCNDNCKQAAYLARQDAAKRARIAAEEAETLRLEMAALRERWGDLLPETVRQLKMLKDRTKIEIADQLVTVIRAEVAQQSNNAANLEEEQAKYAALLADYMQAGKKIAHMEREVHRFDRMGIVKTREAMFHELMLLGGRLTYCSMTDLGIDEGIDAWLNYVRGASNEDLTIAIAQGFYQADRLAMAAIDASDMKVGMEMRHRIDNLEREVVLRDARIAELEWGQGRKAADELHRDQIERLEQKIEELEREAIRRMTEIGRIKESHSSTMFAMNNLLADAQTAQREKAMIEQQVEPTSGDSDHGTLVARLMAVAERLHHCRLLVPHINPGVESWEHFVEQASIEQLQQAIEHAEHYYGSLMYLDELDQHVRQEAREKKAS
jgi:hypothetical protein